MGIGLDIIHKRTVRLRTKRAYTGPKTEPRFPLAKPIEVPLMPDINTDDLFWVAEPNTGMSLVEINGSFPEIRPEHGEFYIDGVLVDKW